MIKVFKEATILKRFRDIKINDFQLPENFVKTNEYEKRKYILNNKDKYKITISKEQKALITLINKFRRENNIDRLKYNETKDKQYWKELIRLLPESWLQKRTITMNYENILNMVKQRKNHKLSEWSLSFIDWARSLPYAKEFIFIDGGKE